MTRRTLTAKQERFCLLIVKGEMQSKAYDLAGYATKSRNVTDANASRLASSARIVARIAELQSNAAVRAEISVEKLTARLMEIDRISMELEQPGSAVAALALAARLNGLLVDHKTVDIMHHKPAPLPTKLLELSESEWKKQFEKK